MKELLWKKSMILILEIRMTRPTKKTFLEQVTFQGNGMISMTIKVMALTANKSPKKKAGTRLTNLSKKLMTQLGGVKLTTI